VVASTLTTVAVFLPLVFVEGIAGALFGDQAMTVAISLLASLLVALTVIPMLAGLGSPISKRDLEQRAGGDQITGETGTLTLGAFSQGYDRLVRGAIARRGLTLFVAFGLFFVSLWSLRFAGTALIPQLSEGEFFFEINLPEGASLAATDNVIRQVEAAADAEDGVERYYSSIGSRLVAGGMSLNTKAENLGQVNIVLANKSDDAVEAGISSRMRERFTSIPDLDAKFGRPSYFSLKTPVEVLLYGDDLEQLRDYSLQVADKLGTVAGLTDVRSSLEAGNPELQIIFDRDRLASLGLDMGVLSETLRDRVQGVVPTRFKEEDRQIDIRVRNREADRASAADVRNLVLPGPDGQPIRLSAVADVRPDRGPAEIHRLQQQRAAVIAANLDGRSLGSVVGEIEDVMANTPPPPGITTELGGQNREMQVSFNSLRFALILAIFLVYLVMAGTFESFIHPLIVLFTIPLALVGVAAGLLATRTTITVIVLIGTIMLVGIVVNNAIVLIDAVNRLRRAGFDKAEAIVRAGHIRLRPILMTTLTTILALLPMASPWGEGAEIRSPLAITVASGLLLSTLLTLVVIPAAYMAVPSKVTVETETQTHASAPAPAGTSPEGAA